MNTEDRLVIPGHITRDQAAQIKLTKPQRAMLSRLDSHRGWYDLLFRAKCQFKQQRRICSRLVAMGLAEQLEDGTSIYRITAAGLAALGGK